MERFFSDAEDDVADLEESIGGRAGEDLCDEDLAGIGRHEIAPGVEPSLGTGGAKVKFSLALEVNDLGEIGNFLLKRSGRIQRQ